MHLQRVTIWAGSIIGSFFCINEEGLGSIINVDRYRVMLRDFVFLNVEEKVWLNRTLLHAAQPTLQSTFGAPSHLATSQQRFD